MMMNNAQQDDDARQYHDDGATVSSYSPSPTITSKVQVTAPLANITEEAPLENIKEEAPLTNIKEEAPLANIKKDDDNETHVTSLMSCAHATQHEASHHSARYHHTSSSLQVRKLPVNDLLLIPSFMKQSSTHTLEEEESRRRPLFCLNPKFELRTQLMLSFDSVNFITILVVVLICVVVSLKTGDNIKAINTSTFSTLAQDVQGRTARYLAESLQHRIIPSDEVLILYETIRDRFQGYPTFMDDSRVPFRNMDTNVSQYPIVAPPLKLDWQLDKTITTNSNENDEHLQGRQEWYGDTPTSTASGAFVMQGACDPLETNSSARTFWENCTNANNNLDTGGILRPSFLLRDIHAKASDLVPTMKALYEYNTNIREIGAGFMNDGRGAAMNFPHYPVNTQSKWTSIGCDWLKQPNPYNPTKPIATQDQIAQCHAEGTVLSAREYSPLGRAWCRDQALNPEKIMVDGPFLNAWVDDTWIVTAGKAVYDRITQEFITCTWVAMSIDFLQAVVKESRVTANSQVSVVRWDPQASVVASSSSSSSGNHNNVSIALFDLNVGMTKESFQDLYNLVDYDTEWDPLEVQGAYEGFTSSGDGFAVAAYPIPPVPDVYDSTYRPVFLTIVSTAEADVFDEVEEVNEDVDERTHLAIDFAVTAGAVGFFLATLVILITATAITMPLQLMNKQAELIIGSFGDEGSAVQEIKPVPVKNSKCVPNTEITDVVTEFNTMISNFSGSLMARTERGKLVEVSNTFGLRNEFMELYDSRETEKDEVTTLGAFRDEGALATIAEDSATSIQFVHTGTNLKLEKLAPRRIVSTKDLRDSVKRTSSSLFIWIVILIVTPLLLTTITISAVVLSTMSREFDESVKDSEAHYLNVALQALSVYAGLRANFVSTYTSRSVRDLYLMSRMASWIMFDGLDRADSFTEAVTAVNECLNATGPDSCQWAIDNFFCDCAWNDEGYPCEEYPEVLSRSRQIPYFFVSSDNALANGTRLSTAHPNNSFSPSTTLWWDGPYNLPGSEKNETASGYATTYDRVRVISSLPLFPVLSNYDVNKENSNAHIIAFEEDGLFFGDEDCFNSRHSFAAFWNSTEENGAEALRPELCPLGKYGFDPRCREWYHTGKRKALEQGQSLHITAPYVFGNLETIAQSATSPLIDPRTNTYVGQVLLDFSVANIFGVLTSSTPLSSGGFPLLLTVETSSSEGDTVIGPGLNGSVLSEPVSEVVMPFDQDCQGDEACVRRMRKFDAIVASMKAGNSSLSDFERKTSDGGTERIYMVSAPVEGHYLDPVDVSDFARGAIMANHSTYSLCLAETEQGILEPFSAIEKEMQRQINVAIGVLAAVIVVAVAATIGISYVVARSISEPMPLLLELVRLLNSQDMDQDPPIVDQTIGSKEIINVSNSMESLYRVVRLANLSFHAGDLEAAYHVLVDALRLFRALDNKKAIGVACNNLGNIMLAMYREMLFENQESKFGVTRQGIIARGTTYFHEAIQLGEKAYDEFFYIEGWSPSCLDFMQHLANRYFNRGIFLLTIKKDHPHPEEIENLGFRDLQVARDMDDEIESQGEECGWGSINRLEKFFNVQLVRVRGYLFLVEMGYCDDWEIDANLRGLFEMLKGESKKRSSDLFKEVSYVGRLQEAETEMMKHLLVKGEVAGAARIAIRMLMEDQCIFLESEIIAIKVLQAFIEFSDCMFDGTRDALKQSLEEIMEDLLDHNETRKQSVSSTRSHRIASKSLRKVGDFLHNSSSSLRWSVTEQSGHFITMEQF